MTILSMIDCTCMESAMGGFGLASSHGYGPSQYPRNVRCTEESGNEEHESLNPSERHFAPH